MLRKDLIELLRKNSMNLVEIAEQLRRVTPPPGRLRLIEGIRNSTIIDDTYNASVASTKAALDLLGSYSGYRIFVLGDMGELGADARAYHEEIGEHAIGTGIDNLYSLGVLSVQSEVRKEGVRKKNLSNFNHSKKGGVFPPFFYLILKLHRYDI